MKRDCGKHGLMACGRRVQLAALATKCDDRCGAWQRQRQGKLQARPRCATSPASSAAPSSCMYTWMCCSSWEGGPGGQKRSSGCVRGCGLARHPAQAGAALLLPLQSRYIQQTDIPPTGNIMRSRMPRAATATRAAANMRRPAAAQLLLFSQLLTISANCFKTHLRGTS